MFDGGSHTLVCFSDPPPLKVATDDLAARRAQEVEEQARRDAEADRRMRRAEINIRAEALFDRHGHLDRPITWYYERARDFIDAEDAFYEGETKDG